VEISGERNGRRERFAVSATFGMHQQDNDFMPRLWASRRSSHSAGESLLRQVLRLVTVPSAAIQHADQ
jgi:hypothetical protein